MSILAYKYPVFQPAMRIISGITNAAQAVVTTTFAHSYLTGLIVRLDIPLGYGMQEINQQFGPITVLSTTTFSIPINTTLFSAFSVPGGYPFNAQSAQSVPFAENTNILTQAVMNVLPYSAT